MNKNKKNDDILSKKVDRLEGILNKENTLNDKKFQYELKKITESKNLYMKNYQ